LIDIEIIQIGPQRYFRAIVTDIGPDDFEHQSFQEMSDHVPSPRKKPVASQAAPRPARLRHINQYELRLRRQPGAAMTRA
jgi:hypothetical protein